MVLTRSSRSLTHSVSIAPDIRAKCQYCGRRKRNSKIREHEQICPQRPPDAQLELQGQPEEEAKAEVNQIAQPEEESEDVPDQTAQNDSEDTLPTTSPSTPNLR